MTVRNETRNAVLYLRPFAAFAAAVLLFLGVSRAGLVIWQLDRVRAAGTLGVTFLEGARFDLVLVGFLLMWPAALLPLAATNARCAAVGRAVLHLYLVGWFALVVFMELATPSFVNEYDARPNRLFVEYLIYPKEVVSTLAGGYAWQFAGAIVAVGALAALFARGLRRLPRPERPMRLASAVLLAPVLFAACALAARSTLDHRAANPSSVALSTDPLVNELALSSLYTVLYSVAELGAEPEGGFRYGSMSDADALRRVRDAMLVPPEDFIDGDIPTLHRQISTAPRAHPKNLVIVLEESLGAEHVGALGGLPTTPRLDALAKQGVWYANLYATGTRSVRGLEALTTGFTPTPAQSVVKLSRSQRNFFSVARLLRAQGYDTSFIYGGESQFDNMRRFFMNNGFDSVVDEDDYVNPVFHGSWGVADEDLFARADEEFSKPRSKPFFSLVFTTSNHSPYEYPAGRIEPYDADPHTVNNAVKYADYALGEFIARARTKPYWDDTVFLVIADHNSRVYGAELVPVERFHIPALILGGGIEAAVYEPVASQIDMPPTLLSMIGVSSQHPMIGHDLTLPRFAAWPGRAIMQYNDTQGYLVGREIAVLRKGLPPATFEYDGAHGLTPIPADAELVANAIAHATWTSATYEALGYRLPDTADARRPSGGPAPVSRKAAPPSTAGPHAPVRTRLSPSS
jgi:phosphoglycerol transferase MdoB-like AlkP superfamily enzyme